MLTISKKPTTREGKDAGPALLAEAGTLVALSTVCPALEEAFNLRSSPKHRQACVEILRKANSDTAAYGIAKLLDVGNTSAFFQKFEGCFVLSRPAAEEVAKLTPEQTLAALGISPPSA